MSIQEQITRLESAKAGIKTAIENKGVTVSADSKLDTYPNYISQIETGGGTGGKIKPSSINFSGFNGESIDLNLLDTSSLTTFRDMFFNCSNLKSIDLSQLDVSGVTTLYEAFGNCVNLEALDLTVFNTGLIGNLQYAFTNCPKLDKTTLIMFNTTNVTNMEMTFYNANTRTSLPTLNADNANRISDFCSNNTELQDFDGLVNLGKAYNTTYAENYSSYRFDLRDCSKLTETSIINILNNLYDIATKGVKTQQCRIGSTNIAKLTSEEGQQALQNATTKGWTVS